ncbi:hypothetical protein ACFSW8_15420 [Rubritalea tangerina]|uniref:Uncharacterized protein n=1 Tax=Rubritalea tangerina TaxID=430798 RepID=A0ABW4ZEN9_9BACT
MRTSKLLTYLGSIKEPSDIETLEAKINGILGARGKISILPTDGEKEVTSYHYDASKFLYQLRIYFVTGIVGEGEEAQIKVMSCEVYSLEKKDQYIEYTFSKEPVLGGESGGSEKPLM